MSEHAVAAFSLYKKYKKQTALNDFSLTVQQGEIHALVGPQGAGKTTVLNILAGTVRPSNGTAKVFNRKAGSLEARRIIGYVPAKPAFYSSMTVLDYLIYMGMLSGVSQFEAASRAIFLLKRVDLHTFRDKKPVDLPVGMKIKVALVQSLLAKPLLLMLDEPVSSLDQAGKTVIMQLIQELSKEEYLSVLITSPLWTDVACITDTITVLKDGKVLMSDQTSRFGRMFQQGVFSLQTSDNDMLLEVLKRMLYLQQIIRTENNLVTVITFEADRFRRDLPGIVYKLKLELLVFRQEEVTLEKISQYLLQQKGG
jgi:ABC-2 type transport system ATP-binding protein